MRSSYRIAIYLRLSKEDEDIHDESNSILNQRILLNGYIRKNFEKYELVEFVDDGFSGTNFRRPGISTLLDQVRNGYFDCIIVKDFSRFSRDYIELGSYLEQIFPFLGVRFISLNDNYDSWNYIGIGSDLNTSFKGLMYDLYSKDLSIKIKSSLESRKEQGQYISGNTPFGYMKSPRDRHILIVAEDEAAIVRRIFTSALEGKTSVEIARELNREHVRTPIEFKIAKCQTNRSPRGDRFQWDHAVICSILKNPVYVGDMVYDKNYRKEVGGKNHLKPRSEWKIRKNHHEAIVSREDFEELQKTRGCNNKKITNKNRHPLQGIVFCAGCKRTLTLSDKKLNPYFSCSRRYYYNDAEKCVSKINLMFLEQYLLYRVSEKMIAQESLEKIQLKREEDTRKTIKCLEQEREKISMRMSALQRERMEAYERSVFDEDFKFQTDDTKISETEQKLEEIENKIEKLKNENSLNNQRFTGGYRKEELKITKELIEELIQKIIVYDEEHIEIEWKPHLNDNAVI